ncbi:GntR family transcriptional regulator [Peterkaempfera griseoplana]|uniref:GntR family transcriptional regulator n=1 Tax=Peterkaempfera griseoplana TaxID=66896 RepID=UPI0006E21390|nr:GntR family transcriptional regulator [Peterkaempfera griseoplana]
MESSVLRKADRRGLAAEAADRIRDAIFAGAFAPGSPLREVDLAADLGVSRGSVREGLGLLEREGLIRTAWHRGTRVIDIAPVDIEEVYSLRAALDRLASLTAHRNAGDQQLADLDRLVTDMEAALDRGAGGAELVALDMAFHSAVYTAAGNTRLTTAWHAIRSQVHLFQLRRVELALDHYRKRVVAEHRQLAELIRDGEPATLAQAAESHVHSARRGLLADLPLPEGEL